LNHPNIVTVYEMGVEGSREFVVTEFIQGITLQAALARGKMNLRNALEIAIQIASALAAAHEAGIVHCDIKPANIMLRPDGYAKVLDFGIAKLAGQESTAAADHAVGAAAVVQTQPAMVIDTARYMSPEQARGQKADARSDIWSLGMVLYEMVAGVPPFPGKTTSECIASILKTEPPPLPSVVPDVPAKLQSIVQKALCKNRDERYATAREMLADLRDLNQKLELEARAPLIKAHAAGLVSYTNVTSEAHSHWRLQCCSQQRLRTSFTLLLQCNDRTKNPSRFYHLPMLARRKIRNTSAMVFRRKS
jgi:eukaryotic-like serine/threonine-protein kinase